MFRSSHMTMLCFVAAAAIAPQAALAAQFWAQGGPKEGRSWGELSGGPNAIYENNRPAGQIVGQASDGHDLYGSGYFPQGLPEIHGWRMEACPGQQIPCWMPLITGTMFITSSEAAEVLGDLQAAGFKGSGIYEIKGQGNAEYVYDGSESRRRYAVKGADGLEYTLGDLYYNKQLLQYQISQGMVPVKVVAPGGQSVQAGDQFEVKIKGPANAPAAAGGELVADSSYDYAAFKVGSGSGSAASANNTNNNNGTTRGTVVPPTASGRSGVGSNVPACNDAHCGDAVAFDGNTITLRDGRTLTADHPSASGSVRTQTGNYVGAPAVAPTTASTSGSGRGTVTSTTTPTTTTTTPTTFGSGRGTVTSTTTPTTTTTTPTAFGSGRWAGTTAPAPVPTTPTTPTTFGSGRGTVTSTTTPTTTTTTPTAFGSGRGAGTTAPVPTTPTTPTAFGSGRGISSVSPTVVAPDTTTPGANGPATTDPISVVSPALTAGPATTPSKSNFQSAF